MSKTYSSLRHENKSKQTFLPMFPIPVNGTIIHPMLPNTHPIFLLQPLPPKCHQSLSILSHPLNLFIFFFLSSVFLPDPVCNYFLPGIQKLSNNSILFLPSNINYQIAKNLTLHMPSILPHPQTQKHKQTKLFFLCSISQ